MKKIITFLFLTAVIISTKAQNSYEENSLGVSYTVSTIASGYDYGIGLIASQDYGTNGEGIGLIAHFNVLFPNEALEGFIDYGYTFDALLKYDITIAESFQIAPTAGGGYFGVQSDGEAATDFYFAAGASATYFLTPGIVLGLDLTNQFLEGADSSIYVSIRFQI